MLSPLNQLVSIDDVGVSLMVRAIVSATAFTEVVMGTSTRMLAEETLGAFTVASVNT